MGFVRFRCYLKATAKFAACLAEAIKGIISLYKVVINVRKYRSEMLEDGVPKERLKDLGKYANDVMTEGVEKLTIEIVQNFGSKITDDHRRQELTNRTRISLTRIAKRIDHGFNIEVRVEPPVVPESETAKKGEDKELAKSVKIIQEASKQMQFINLQGQHRQAVVHRQARLLATGQGLGGTGISARRRQT